MTNIFEYAKEQVDFFHPSIDQSQLDLYKVIMMVS